jgi:hypothetical protein
MAPVSTPFNLQRRSFGRTGHRTPRQSCGGDVHNDDWRDETLRALVQEVASLKLRVPENECVRCVDLQRRVSELTAELATLKAGRQGVAGPAPPQHPARVDKWRPTEKTPLLAEYFLCRSLPWENSRGKCHLSVVRADVVQADEQFKFHFVSADMRRSKGVALRFAEVFGPVSSEHSADGYAIGHVVRQEKDGHVLLNLVTKRRYYHKPGGNPERFLTNILAALLSLRDYCEANNIRRLALPRVGSNLDRISWRWTQRKLLETFEGLDVELVVYLGARQRPERRRRKRPDERVHQSEGRVQRDEPQDPVIPVDFPRLDDSRVMRRVRRTGLHKGRGADACGGSALAGRLGASNGPPAQPEANLLADDGSSAFAQPSSEAQVRANNDVTEHSELTSRCYVDLARTSPSAVMAGVGVSLPGPVELRGDGRNDDLIEVLGEGDLPDVPAHVSRGAGVTTGSQGDGVGRHSLALAWEPGASTRAVSAVPGFVPAVPGPTPTHLLATGEPLDLVTPLEPTVLVLVDKLGAAPENVVFANSRSSHPGDNDSDADSDGSLLLFESPGEREVGRLPPPIGQPGSPF